MESKAWELLVTLIGSGVVFSLITWAIAKVKQAGTDEARFEAQCKDVKDMKLHQEEQDVAIRKLEKRMEEIDHNIDVRLTSIEVEVTHIREMQMSHNSDLRSASEDIKSLLRISKKE